MSKSEKQLQQDATELTRKVVTELYGQSASKKTISDVAKRVAKAVAPALSAAPSNGRSAPCQM